MDYCASLMRKCRETGKFNLFYRTAIIERGEKDDAVFSEEENNLNLRRCQKKQFYDQSVCRHLCSKTLVLESTKTVPFSPCELICFELTRSFDSAGEVCPNQKYCSNGCPCPFYNCEKFEWQQKLIPVFDLEKGTSSGEAAAISDESISTTTASTETELEGVNKTDADSSFDFMTGWWKDRESKAEKFSFDFSAILGLNSGDSSNSSSTTASPTTITSTTSTQSTTFVSRTTQSSVTESIESKGSLSAEWITGRWSDQESKTYPLLLYDFSESKKAVEIETNDSFFSYERFQEKTERTKEKKYNRENF